MDSSVQQQAGTTVLPGPLVSSFPAAINPDSSRAFAFADVLHATVEQVFADPQQKVPHQVKSLVIPDVCSFINLVLKHAHRATRNTIAKDTCDDIAKITYGANKKYITLTSNGAGYLPSAGTKWSAVWNGLKKAQTTSDRPTKLEEALFAFADRWVIRLIYPLLKSSSNSRSNKTTQDVGKKKNDREQSFTDEVLERDDFACAITRAIKVGEKADEAVKRKRNNGQAVYRSSIEVAHIIPHHLKRDDEFAKLCITDVALFGGVNMDQLKKAIDHPANGIPLDICVHRSFDRLEWSIEVTDDGKYLYRHMRGIPSIGLLNKSTADIVNGMELRFQGGTDKIYAPSKRLCKIHHAICTVIAAAGLADIFDKFEDDDDMDVDAVFADTGYARINKYEETMTEEDVRGGGGKKKLKTEISSLSLRDTDLFADISGHGEVWYNGIITSN